MPEPSVYHSWPDIYKILKPSFLHNATLFILHTLLLFRVTEDKEDPQEDQENLADQWVGETLCKLFFDLKENIYEQKSEMIYF